MDQHNLSILLALVRHPTVLFPKSPNSVAAGSTHAVFRAVTEQHFDLHPMGFVCTTRRATTFYYIQRDRDANNAGHGEHEEEEHTYFSCTSHSSRLLDTGHLSILRFEKYFLLPYSFTYPGFQLPRPASCMSSVEKQRVPRYDQRKCIR